MQTICIDWGNTRVKVGIFNATGFLVKDYIFDKELAVKEIATLISDHNIPQGILCHVSTVPNNLIEFFREEKGFMIFDHQTALPIINAYETPETLGLDRIAGVIGAHSIDTESNNLVISVGTALVFTYLTKNKILRGGSIAPGLRMRCLALNQFTELLPLVEPTGNYTLVGYDTESSIKSGAFFGMLHEIDGTIQAYKENFSDINVTITGGDASLFAMKLKNKIFADPFIILKGLYQIYTYNAK